jgi:OmcA/MtrC family decaheme c-type cytochrome
MLIDGLNRLPRVAVAAATAALLLLHGCGGSDGGPPPATTPTPGTPPPALIPPSSINASQMSAQQFAALQFNATITSVTVASAPVVNFTVTNESGVGISGLGLATKSSSATVPRYQNLAFSMAKLIQDPQLGGGGPSRWISYIVTTVPTSTAPAATAQRPSTDSNGTLVDNGNGTYKYTFYRDITQVKAQVDAMKLSGLNVAADLGDLSYKPDVIHRVVLQISGSAPGTGTNTPNEVQSTPAVPIRHPNNAVFDFIPATNQPVPVTDPYNRLIVDKLSCNECHGKLGGMPGTDSQGFHGGSRYDPRFCVTCHTDQRKYGRANAKSVDNVFTGDTYVADGVTMGNFPVLIHRVHKGEFLVKQGYNYAGLPLNETKFPQDIRNCTKCHDGTAPKVAPQAAYFKTVPSRLACGACHDGIDFATGQGVTNAAFNQAKINGTKAAATGHLGGAQSDDANCSSCHDATSIEKVYHLPIVPPNPGNALVVNGGDSNTNAAWIASNVSNLPPGAVKVSYEVVGVSRNVARRPVIVFKVLFNGVPGTINTFGSGATEMWPGFMGAPSVQFAFSVPQDGVAAPSDFNATASGYLRSIWNGTATGTGAGTLVGPDADGNYTVTLTGVTVPDSAKMLTGGVGYSYGLKNTMPLTQTNLVDNSLMDPNRRPRFGLTPATATDLTPGMPNMQGGLIVIAPDAQKVAVGYTGRRAIVEDKRCNSCHEELGVFTTTSFHGAQRNDGSTCAFCHTPNRTSSGWAADSTAFIHSIHASDKRAVPFTWHASAVGESFANIKYPGILNRCETCHLPGTYDFSSAEFTAQASSRLFRTVAAGTVVTSASTALQKYSTSPYVAPGTNYGSGFSFNAGTGAATQAAATTLVTSPTTAACFACHDSTSAQSHMTANGGAIYEPRSTALAKSEGCLSCHGPGGVADVKTMHSK